MKSQIPPGLIVYNREESKRTQQQLYYVVKIRQSLGWGAISRREAAWLRNRARKALNKMPNLCLCGYSGAVEVAHFYPISSFALGTPESVINHPRNLRKLCRNCHHELDSKKMKTEHYSALMLYDGSPLTEKDVTQGWHNCPMVDGLLIGPGMKNEECCLC